MRTEKVLVTNTKTLLSSSFFILYFKTLPVILASDFFSILLSLFFVLIFFIFLGLIYQAKKWSTLFQTALLSTHTPIKWKYTDLY